MSTIKAQIETQTSKKAIVDEFEVKRWLQGKSEGTKRTYLYALMVFIDYTGLTPKKLIDLADEDRKKNVRERGDPEYKVLGFYDWLTSNYLSKSKGKYKGKIGVSRTLACTYANSMRGFYKSNGFPLHLEIPKSIPKKENSKLPLRAPEIKRLLDVTTNLRDKAIILALFQSGMSISELCNLSLRDVATGLKNNEEPLNLHLIRKKEQVEYDTFLGIDAIESLKSYLDQRKRNGENLTLESPLFILQFTTNPRSSKDKRINPNIVEAFLRSTALKAGLVTQEELKIADFNPCRPHALRTAFISILKAAGMNNTMVEYLCGHTISSTDKAYLRVTIEELRRLYKQHEKYLSISGMVDNEKLEALEQKAKVLEQDTRTNQGVINALLENGKNKDIQVNSLTTLLLQVQESLAKINDDMDFHRLEDLARFVAAKVPTGEELNSFMAKRRIPQSIFQRIELQCIKFRPQNNTWVYLAENDLANLLMA